MMMRQSLVDERVSALHHHTLQPSGDNDNEISKTTSRRVPAPVASRIVITKNTSLLSTGDEPSVNSPSSTPSPTLTVDPRARVELLERNLRYVQQQHEITLADLHNEISRLQQDNRDLHFRMVDLNPLSSSSNQQNKTETIPTIHQLADLTQNEPVLEKRLQEVQRLHFEQQIDELRTRLIESEQKNEYLMRQIDELNKEKLVQIPQTTDSNVVPVLLPDPNTTIEANISISIDQNENKIDRSDQIHINENEHQHLLKIAYDKQRQQLQEITRLRAVLREILNAERLSSTTKILVRDCLASGSINENIPTISTTPIDVVYHTTNLQHRSIASSSTAGKNLSLRHELPLRRLNLSPPQFIAPRSTRQTRQPEQRLVLPPISQPNSASMLSSQDPTSVTGLLHSSLSQTNTGTQQKLLKIGETPVARRERRTQELQRTRLTRNLYH